MTETHELPVDIDSLRAEVQDKYRAVAVEPNAEFHFHTGRRLAAKLGYDPHVVDSLPDVAVESFAGVGNPFSIRPLEAGEHVVDVGSGAGFDSFVAARAVGSTGSVVGVDMTAEMLTKSRATAAELKLTNVEFREGFAEALPVPFFSRQLFAHPIFITCVPIHSNGDLRMPRCSMASGSPTVRSCWSRCKQSLANF